MIKEEVFKRGIGLLLVCSMAFIILGCVAAIPVAVMYYQEKQKYVATAEIPAPAQKVYGAAVTIADDHTFDLSAEDAVFLTFEMQ